jgi:hypothetical protein
MMRPSSPPPLDGFGAPAAANLRKSAIAHGIPVSEERLHATALAASAYVRLATLLTRMAAGRGAPLPQPAEDSRLEVRGYLLSWRWIAAVEPSPPLRADGIDADIARVCGLPEAAGGGPDAPHD